MSTKSHPSLVLVALEAVVVSSALGCRYAQPQYWSEKNGCCANLLYGYRPLVDDGKQVGRFDFVSCSMLIFGQSHAIVTHPRFVVANVSLSRTPSAIRCTQVHNQSLEYLMSRLLLSTVRTDPAAAGGQIRPRAPGDRAKLQVRANQTTGGRKVRRLARGSNE